MSRRGGIALETERSSARRDWAASMLSMKSSAEYDVGKLRNKPGAAVRELRAASCRIAASGLAGRIH